MLHQVYSVYDTAAKAYLPPFHLPRHEIAIRAFTDCVNSPSHQFGAHPQDYTLHHLGEFDDATGLVTAPARGPHCITTALAVKNAPSPELFPAKESH